MPLKVTRRPFIKTFNVAALCVSPGTLAPRCARMCSVSQCFNNKNGNSLIRALMEFNKPVVCGTSIFIYSSCMSAYVVGDNPVPCNLIAVCHMKLCFQPLFYINFVDVALLLLLLFGAEFLFFLIGLPLPLLLWIQLSLIISTLA